MKSQFLPVTQGMFFEYHSEMKAEFRALHCRRDSFEKRMDVFEQRMDALESRMGAFEDRFDSLNLKIDSMDKKGDAHFHEIKLLIEDQNARDKA